MAILCKSLEVNKGFSALILIIIRRDAVIDVRHQDRCFKVLERYTIHNGIEVFFFRLHAAEAHDLFQKQTKAAVIFYFLDFVAHAHASVL